MLNSFIPELPMEIFQHLTEGIYVLLNESNGAISNSLSTN